MSTMQLKSSFSLKVLSFNVALLACAVTYILL